MLGPRIAVACCFSGLLLLLPALLCLSQVTLVRRGNQRHRLLPPRSGCYVIDIRDFSLRDHRFAGERADVECPAVGLQREEDQEQPDEDPRVETKK